MGQKAESEVVTMKAVRKEERPTTRGVERTPLEQKTTNSKHVKSSKEMRD